MAPFFQAIITIILTHFSNQWPYPHPFVSAAQKQADFRDASPVGQWAPFVRGCVLGPSITAAAMWDLLPSDVRGGGDWEEGLVALGTEGHVAPNEVSACHRASHQTGEQACALQQVHTPREEREDVQKSSNQSASNRQNVRLSHIYRCGQKRKTISKAPRIVREVMEVAANGWWTIT